MGACFWKSSTSVGWGVSISSIQNSMSSIQNIPEAVSLDWSTAHGHQHSRHWPNQGLRTEDSRRISWETSEGSWDLGSNASLHGSTCISDQSLILPGAVAVAEANPEATPRNGWKMDRKSLAFKNFTVRLRINLQCFPIVVPSTNCFFTCHAEWLSVDSCREPTASGEKRRSFRWLQTAEFPQELGRPTVSTIVTYSIGSSFLAPFSCDRRPWKITGSSKFQTTSRWLRGKQRFSLNPTGCDLHLPIAVRGASLQFPWDAVWFGDKTWWNQNKDKCPKLTSWELFHWPI